MPLIHPHFLTKFSFITNLIISDNTFDRIEQNISSQAIYEIDLEETDSERLEYDVNQWKEIDSSYIPIVFNHSLWITDPRTTFRHLNRDRKPFQCPYCLKCYSNLKLARRHNIEARCIVITCYKNIPTIKRIEKVSHHEMSAEIGPDYF